MASASSDSAVLYIIVIRFDVLLIINNVFELLGSRYVAHWKYGSQIAYKYLFLQVSQSFHISCDHGIRKEPETLASL